MQKIRPDMDIGAKLETNRMNIKVSELVALAKIFHTDINAFFDGLL